jgi:hypothetical protein
MDILLHLIYFRNLLKPGKVAHTSNASYSGGGDQDYCSLSQYDQKVSETPSQQKAGCGEVGLIIPAP